MSASSEELAVAEPASASESQKVSNVTEEQARQRSPLWMVSQEPLLNDLVAYLGHFKEQIERAPECHHEMTFSRAQLKKSRAAFDRMIRKGEEGLHRLCELFCDSFVGGYQLQSVVFGETPTTSERFTLTQILSRQDLYSTIDLDLGNRQLRKLKYFDGSAWVSPALVANMVEYQPTQPNSHGVHKIISRIKAEEELWNKVVDEIFHLDSLVTRDKELRHLSYYVKDIFGIKIVVGTPEEVVRLHHELEKLEFDPTQLLAVDEQCTAQVSRLKFLETKDYLRNSEKNSGWEAMKSVVQWGGKMFEIQVQPLGNFWREREHLTRESHAGFKSRREEIRSQVAQRIPLFRFYQSLLRWLIQLPETPPPAFAGVSIVLTD
jgi:ppGpp synthetase/RelA/SpoT-type nucleotidyltranferase